MIPLKNCLEQIMKNEKMLEGYTVFLKNIFYLEEQFLKLGYICDNSE
jgi:hypothetical protein